MTRADIAALPRWFRERVVAIHDATTLNWDESYLCAAAGFQPASARLQLYCVLRANGCPPDVALKVICAVDVNDPVASAETLYSDLLAAQQHDVWAQWDSAWREFLGALALSWPGRVVTWLLDHVAALLARVTRRRASRTA